MTQDSCIQARVDELAKEAKITLEAIRELTPNKVDDPFVDPVTLTQAVQVGVLDAPQLKNNPIARGQIATRIDSRGACIAIEPTSGNPLSERNRIASLTSLKKR
jgi:hypothetical protein